MLVSHVAWNAPSDFECSVPVAALFYDTLTLAILHDSVFQIYRLEIKVLLHAEIRLDWSWDIALEYLRPGDYYFFNNKLVFLKTKQEKKKCFLFPTESMGKALSQCQCPGSDSSWCDKL